MVRTDPSTPDRGYVECRSCNNRGTAERRVADRPDCGSAVRNLAVARE